MKTILFLFVNLFFVNLSYSQYEMVTETDSIKITKIHTAIDEINELLLKNPKDGMLYIKRSSFYIALEKYKEAKEDLSKGIEINPDNSILFFSHYRRGALNDRLGLLNEAYDDFSKTIELEPKFEWAYLDRGMILSDYRHYEEADKDFLYALKLKPNWNDALFCMGLNFSEKGNIEKAIYYYLQAIKYNNKESIFSYKAYNNLGLIYGAQKKYQLALENFENAIKIKPDYALAFVNSAIVKYQLGNKKEGCKDLSKAIQLGRKDKQQVFDEFCK